jgi:hypothetical protein
MLLMEFGVFASEAGWATTDVQEYGFGAIAFPCDETPVGPGSRCGSGQET